MAFRPNHYALFILNQDGSGSIKQYTDYQSAKAAYLEFNTSGSTVWLYPQPIASLTTSTTPPAQFAPPVATTATFTTSENTKAAEMAPVVTPAFTNAPPTHPPRGTVLYASCVTAAHYSSLMGESIPQPLYDKINVNWTNTAQVIYVERIADGTGNILEFRTPYPVGGGGCFFPNNYATTEINIPTYFNNLLTPSSAILLVVGGYIQGLDNNPEASIGIVHTRAIFGDSWSDITVADGSGGTRPKRIYGILTNTEPNVSLRDYAHNDTLLNINLDGTYDIMSLGGLAVHYVTAAHGGKTSYGKWFANFDYYVPATSGARTAKVILWYEPQGNVIDAKDTIPPPGVAGRPILDEFGSGEITAINSAEAIPVTKYEEEVSYEQTDIRGNTYNLGHTWINHIESRYSYTSEPAFEWYPSGTSIGSDSEYDYYSDGNGWYYEVIKDGEPPPPPCPTSGALLDYRYEDITVSPDYDNVGVLTIGTKTINIRADGTCGTYEEDGDANYLPSGTFVGAGDANDFYSNGSGSYYAEQRVVNPPIGTDLGTYTDTPIYDQGIQVGYQRQSHIADGQGGYDLGAGPDTFYPAGTYLGEREGIYYYSTGSGQAYTSYAPAGTPMGTGGETIYYDAGCGPWSIGSSTYPILADGMGGTYNAEGSTSYTQSGYQIGECGGYTYYSDGSGGVSSYATNGTPAGSTTQPIYVNYGYGLWQIGESTTPLFADGSGGTYEGSSTTTYVPTDTLIGIGGGTAYYYNGNGGTYSSNCPMSGEYISSGSSPYNYGTACGDWQIGESQTGVYADGNCGTYESNNTYWYQASSYDCGDTRYIHNGSGTVTTESINTCPSNGTFLYSDECNNYYADGTCNTYSVPNGNCGGGGGGGECTSQGNQVGAGSDPIYVNTPCGDFSIGYTEWTDYADGMCGVNRMTGSTQYYSNGTYLGECNGCQIYSDGSGSYYTDCVQPPPPEDVCYYSGGETATDDTSSESSGDDGWNTLYNDDGSVYATYDGESWTIV